MIKQKSERVLLDLDDTSVVSALAECSFDLGIS